MRTGAGARALLLTVVLGGALAVQACSSSTRGHVPAVRAAGPKIVVTVRGGCPATLGRATDVRNDGDGLSDHLLSGGMKPVRGLVCEYRSMQTPPFPTRLASSVRLEAADARRLATVIQNVSLRPARGAFSCPEQEFGTVAVLAFDYGDHTVDLWYQWSGCQTLDNGHVLAFQGANPSFYSRFQTVFDSLAPLPPQ